MSITNAAWGFAFEQHLMVLMPKAIGEIDWGFAEYLCKLGMPPHKAAKYYAAKANKEDERK